MIGQRLDHYRIEKLLGRGGMGEVYLARDERLGRHVAIKLLGKDLVADREALKRFQTEARAVAELSHPHIATLHDLGEIDGRPYLVLEHIDGETLSERIARGPRPLEEVLHLGQAVARGLAHAHEHGVVHRDVKSSNVMVDASGEPKILDFGLARVEDVTRMTKAGTSLGTVAYMSPEQLGGEDVDHRTDIWSLGVVLYELIVGKTPFQRESSAAVLHAIAGHPPQPLTTQRTGVPLELERIVMKCLEKDPAKRYQSIEEVAVDLMRLSHEHSQATTSSQTLPPPRRRRWAYSVLTTAVVAVIAVAIVMLKPRDSIPFAERDWILVTDFENRTGDVDFERTLNTALEVSLQQSRHVNVFPRGRIRETLERMEKDPDSAIDEALGQEIALREAIRILIVCTISKVETEYSLTARIVDPETQVALRTEAQRASDKGDVLDALDSMADWVRNNLGESLSVISHDRVALPAATTSSFEALKAFTEGVRAFGARRFPDAHRHLTSAIEQDSTFALAHVRLGASYCWSGNIMEGEAHFQTALGLQDRLTERERLLLRPTIEGWRSNREAAVTGYREYLSHFPDDSHAWHSLGYQYMRLELCDEARDAFAKVLEFNPRDAAASINIGTCLAAVGRQEEALPYYLEAFDIEPEWRTSYNLNHEFGFAQVGLGRLEDAEATFRLMLDESPASKKAWGCRSLALLDMFRGRYRSALDWLEESRMHFQSENSPVSTFRVRLFEAAAHSRLGDRAAAGRELSELVRSVQLNYYGSYWVALLGTAMARAEDIDGLRTVTNLVEANVKEENQEERTAVARLRGELALVQGDFDGAVQLLEQASALSSNNLEQEALARCHYQAGDLAGAYRCYQNTLDEKVMGWEAQELWVEAHYWLGRIEQERDNLDESARWYEALLELWKDADAGLPLLLETRERLAAVQKARAG